MEQEHQIPSAFVRVHEYHSVSPKLARITASVTPMRPLTDEETFDAISASLPPGVSAVRSSFFDVGNDTFAGFVFSAPEMRLLNDESTIKEVKAGRYREVAKNIYVDSKDNALWDVKEGAGGKFLMRQGADDLSALLEKARVSPTGPVVKMASIASVQPAMNEFVGYVRAGRVQHEMDYGVVLSKTGDVHYVLSTASRSIVPVHTDHVVVSTALEVANLPKLPSKAVERLRLAASKRGAVVAANGKINMTPEEYWKAVYSYAPEYLDEVLKQVRSMSNA